jgi:hypothetical protein
LRKFFVAAILKENKILMSVILLKNYAKLGLGGVIESTL